MPFQARDTSGPMDLDEVNPFSRVAEYAVGYQDGPSRKRLHSEHATIHDPFSHPPSQMRFGPNTPFLFHAPPLPPAQKFEPYDPNRWARADFGFGAASASTSGVNGIGGGGGSGVRDIEMAGDSPARGGEMGQGQGVQGDAGAGSGAGGEAGNAGSGVGGSASTSASAEKQGTNMKAEETKKAEDTTAAERPIANGAVMRIRKKRQKEWSARRRRGSESDPDEYNDRRRDQSVARSRAQPSEHHYNLHMSAPAVRHSEIPAILLGYVQFVFNGSLVLGFLYIALQFILAVRRDVQDRIEEYSVEILQEIAGCTNMYLTNRCEPSLRVPAMEAACSAWEMCMNRDPTVVGRARVGAETFAGVINSFVDPISWKTMGFTLVTLTFLIAITNSALFNLRARHQHPPPQPPAAPSGLYSPQPHAPLPGGLGWGYDPTHGQGHATYLNYGQQPGHTGGMQYYGGRQSLGPGTGPGPAGKLGALEVSKDGKKSGGWKIW